MEQRDRWWLGSFPTWIVMVLLGLIGWFVKQLWTDQQNMQARMHSTVAELTIRLTVCEVKLQETHEMVHNIEKLLEMKAKGDK